MEQNLLCSVQTVLAILIAVVVFTAIPGFVAASPIVRTGEEVSVEADQILEGDFYAVGDTVRLSGEGKHDVLGIAVSITLNAPVAGDALFVGGDVDVHGSVGDDVRVLGGQVVVAERVAGDLVVIAEQLTVLSTARIEGDVLFFGKSATISGEVGGNIGGAAESVRIDTKVNGNVDMKLAGVLTLGDKTEILGTVSYTSPMTLVRAPGAVVVGTVQKTEVSPVEADSSFGFMVPVLMVLFAALIFFVLGKNRLGQFVHDTIFAYGMKGLIGLGILILVPFISLLLMVSILGFIVGTVLFITYLATLLVAWVLSGVVVGAACMQIFFKRDPVVNVWSVVVGTIVFNLLFLVPIIGFIAAFAIFAIVLGGIWSRLYQFVR